MTEQNGFFSRAWRSFKDLWVSAPPPPPAVQHTRQEYEPPDGSEPLEVAARGDVFHLTLMPYFRWSADTMTFAKLSERSVTYVPAARGRLLREVWKTARQFGPSQLAEAEEAINNLAVVREGWCYQDEAGMIRCTPTVRVLLDARLRDQLVPLEIRRLELDEAFKYNTAKSQYAEQLTTKWLHIIKSLEQIPELGPNERQFLVPFAASLSDHDFAVVMHNLAGQRADRKTDLVAMLQVASKNHESLGLFEFAKAYDMAAQAYAKQLGLGPHRWNLSDINAAGDR